MILATLSTLLLLATCTYGQEDVLLQIPEEAFGPSEVFFVPSNLTKVKEKTQHQVEWTTTLRGAHHAGYTIANEMVSSVTFFEEFFNLSLIADDNNITGRGVLNVSADFIGYNVINITIYDEYNNTLGVGKLPMSVLLAYQRLNSIFTYILSVLIAIVYVNMGATIDLSVVKQIVVKPIGPLVGVLCQYLIMPLLAFGLAKLFFSGNPMLQLGMFLNGASPGGGPSNMWTYLLGGSLDLSIMMTFFSTIVAFGAVPAWVLMLGPKIAGEDSQFTIPYTNIAMIVVSLIVPCSIGILIQLFIPRLAKFLEKRVLGPIAIFNIVFTFTFGVWTHRYIFYILTWKTLLACFALPGLGYLSGLIISFLCRRTLKEIIAISIETGVQNANIAIIILKFTLEAPAGDLTVVIPACIVIMTPIPLLVLLLIKKIYGRFAHSDGQDLFTPSDLTLQMPGKQGFDNPCANELQTPQMNLAIPNELTANGFVKKRNLEGVYNSFVDLNDERV